MNSSYMFRSIEYIYLKIFLIINEYFFINNYFKSKMNKIDELEIRDEEK